VLTLVCSVVQAVMTLVCSVVQAVLPLVKVSSVVKAVQFQTSLHAELLDDSAFLDPMLFPKTELGWALSSLYRPNEC
jgi:hypothetical protein